MIVPNGPRRWMILLLTVLAALTGVKVAVDSEGVLSSFQNLTDGK